MSTIFTLFIFCFSLFAVCCYATSPHEEYKKIQREIKIHREKLERTKKLEHSVATDIERINRQLSDVEAQLKKLRKKLGDTKTEISKVKAEISHNKTKIDTLKVWIKRKLRAMQKYGYQSDIVMLLSAEDISQMSRVWKSLQYITAYEHRVLSLYKANLESLNKEERVLTKLKAELIKDEEKAKAKEAALTEKMKDKRLLLASVRKEKISHEKMLKELKEASRKLLEVIKDSERIDTYYAKGFSELKGWLPWPVEGKVVIPYGSQRDIRFDTPVFRSGIYIQSAANSVAKAVHTGKVVFAEWLKGYGQLVIVSHGEGYHTLYGSLSEIFPKVGDIIKTGQAIGEVGNSGIFDAPGLYFEVRYKGKPLDPSQWLKKR